MGIFDFWRKKEKPQGLVYAPTNTGGTPFYTSFGENVYASDIIVQSIRCKANEFKKLDPRHIKITDGVKTVVNDSSIARVLKRPNPYMTIAEFLEKITILLEFVIPAIRWEDIILLLLNNLHTVSSWDHLHRDRSGFKLA